jgi:hypothetical protein
MNSINANKVNLDLWRARSGFNTLEAIQSANTMLNNGDLIAAATVTCERSDLFELTNTISQSWVDNEEVTVISNNTRLYSSSVGDVFTDMEGNFYIISTSDFVPFNRE